MMKETDALLTVLADLRGLDGDHSRAAIESLFASTSAYTVAEAYEVADAAERKNMDDLKSELGDVLFQVVFHAQMTAQNDRFNFADMVASVNNKLMLRHPQVCANDAAADEEKISQSEAAHKNNDCAQKNQPISSNQVSGYLDGIASTMSALRWSEKLQKRAANHGFDWDSIDPVFAKLNEEVAELRAEAGVADNQKNIVDEMGDVLFASVTLCRHLEVDPEQALRASSGKFILRFELVEKLLREDGKQMEGCSVAVLEDYWRRAKKLAHS